MSLTNIVVLILFSLVAIIGIGAIVGQPPKENVNFVPGGEQSNHGENSGRSGR